MRGFKKKKACLPAEFNPFLLLFSVFTNYPCQQTLFMARMPKLPERMMKLFRVDQTLRGPLNPRQLSVRSVLGAKHLLGSDAF